MKKPILVTLALFCGIGFAIAHAAPSAATPAPAPAPPAAPAENPAARAKVVEEILSSPFLDSRFSYFIDQESRKEILADPRIRPEEQAALIKALSESVSHAPFRDLFVSDFERTFTEVELRYFRDFWRSNLFTRYQAFVVQQENSSVVAGRAMVRENYEKVTHLAPREFHPSWLTRLLWKFFPETKIQDPCRFCG